MAGAWGKVKNCLTDIEMFQLWWTPKFKTDFIKFWASLTQLTSKTSEEPKVRGAGATGSLVSRNKKTEGETEHTTSSSSRPTYDIVEEYVKSLDEYRNARHPSDESVAGIILEIGDFLLEFATLGHEENADVPANVHPKVCVLCV
jgi:hypothetical protein